MIDETVTGGPPPGTRTMAWVRWALVVAMAVAAALSMAYSFGLLATQSASAAGTRYYCPMHPQVVQDHPGECPICSMSLVPQEPSAASAAAPPPKAAPKPKQPDHAGHRHEPSDPYFCPMHPEETGQDEKARCPICGMKLEKRGAPQGVPGLAPIMLSLDRTQLIGVRTADVRAGELSGGLKAVGFVSADESRLSRVHARFAGWIESMGVRASGEKVKAGQTLASIYNVELAPAQQELLAARKWATSPANAGLERDARERLRLFGMSTAEIDRVVETGKPARTIAVSAPSSGYVVRRNVVQGPYVDPGTELFEIADLSRVWVLADIYEQDMARLAVGQEAAVTSSAYPGERFTGKVAFIYPVVDSSSRTLRVRVELENRALKLRPGMYADVALSTSGAQAAMIPSEALVDTGEHQYVFLAKEKGTFEPRLVKVGPRSGDEIQILEGVAVGEQVVTTANFLLDSESRLRSAIHGSAK
jgi:membrane fusion protein, copper/silver efflux system